MSAIQVLPSLGRRVFQPRRRRVQLVESRERLTDVGFVEEFAAADQIALDGQEVDLLPLRVEAFFEVPRVVLVMTTPRSVSRCTASM